MIFISTLFSNIIRVSSRFRDIAVKRYNMCMLMIRNVGNVYTIPKMNGRC